MWESFQVKISPPPRKAKNVVQKKETLVVSPKLVLAPFNSTPEIYFGDISVGDTIAADLIISNPTVCPITVCFSNIDFEKDRISCDKEQVALNGNEECKVVIIWSPICEGSIRTVIKVKDCARSVRTFDVIAVGTAVHPHKAQVARKGNLRKLSKRTSTQSSKSVGNGKSKLIPLRESKTMKCFDVVKLAPAFDYSKMQNFDTGENKENSEPIITSLDGHDNNRLNFSNNSTISPVTRMFRNGITSSIENLLPLQNKSIADSSYFSLDVEPILMQLNSIGLKTLDTDEDRRNTYNITTSTAPNKNLPKIDYDEVDTGDIISKGFKLMETSDDVSKFGSVSEDRLHDSLESPDRGNNDSLYSVNVSDQTSFYTANDSTPENDVDGFSMPLDKTFTQKVEVPQISKPKCKIISPPVSQKWHVRSGSDYYTPARTLRKRKSREMSSPFNIRARNQEVKREGIMKKPRRKSSSPKIKIQLSPKSPKYKPSVRSDDPFARLVAYYDEEWLDRQEVDTIKWLNSLLTPSAELDPDSDKWTVDAAEVWVKSSRDTDVKLAPSKEYFASILYHCPQQLDTLRKAATALMKSDAVASVLMKLSESIGSKTLAIREDRDLHLDQGLRSKLMELLSFYNPLWLRIGLETIYNQRIVISPNSNISGLGTFIKKNLFSNDYIIKKHSHCALPNMRLPSFKDAMKKFILKKFLTLIFFLDQAKIKKLIRHDPCLFTKKSVCKSSNEILLSFCGDLVVGHGDIIKHLRYMKYILIYKQTCLDEYDYCINRLLDLRDGVHLARMLEILLRQNDLCPKLRVPAISLLQKIHNVKICMVALEKKCPIQGRITPNDIVKGHREKTLSLLWQIVNNYLTPKYNAAAMKLQNWWRKQYFKLIIERRITENRERQAAVLKIQHWWRNKNFLTKIRKSVQIIKLEKFNNAALMIQKIWKGYYCRKEFEKYKILIEERKQLINRSVVIIQRRFRANKIMRQYRYSFLQQKSAVIFIQSKYRANKIASEYRRRFMELKKVAQIVQNNFRSKKLMQRERTNFLKLKSSAIFIQRRFRANLIMRKNYESFTKLKIATLLIQRKFRANILMRKVRKNYLELRKATIFIQQKFWANKLHLKYRKEYLNLKTATIFIQRIYRANKMALNDREYYSKLKNSTIFIQRTYRAKKLAYQQRNDYLKLKSVTIFIQKSYRSKKLAIRCREEFVRLKCTTIFIQQKFRANKLANRFRNEYLTLKSQTVFLQRKYRANKLGFNQRQRYLELTAATSFVQRKFRANRCRQDYLKLKSAAIFIQQKYRAHKQRKEYLELKIQTIFVQRMYRSNQLAHQQREQFLKLKAATIFVQRTFRCKMLTIRCTNEFLKLKSTTIFIQQKYRAQKLAHKFREEYLKLKTTTIFIQRIYRANKIGRKCRDKYLELKASAVVIQRSFRSKRLAIKCREDYLTLKSTTIFIQQKYRAQKLAHKFREEYLKLKTATIFIQRIYRANKLAYYEKQKYSELKIAAICIQRQYRAKRCAIRSREEYLKLKFATIFVQRKYRAHKLAQKQREQYLKLKAQTIFVQRIYRANKLACQQREQFLKLKAATIFVQRTFRSKMLTIRCRKEFLKLKSAATFIQKNYRSKLLSNDRKEFLNLKAATLFVQRRYRTKMCSRLVIKNTSAVKIQALWRGYRIRKMDLIKKYVPPVMENGKYMTRGTLSERYRQAIQLLKSSEMYSTVLKALHNLEKVTRLSQRLCERITEEGVIELIMGLLKRTNRSVPSLDLCRVGISVLINLARYYKTMPLVWNALSRNNYDGLLTLAHIMKYMHDKLNDTLFLHVTTLLWILIKDAQIKQEISKIVLLQKQLEHIVGNLKNKTSKVKIPRGILPSLKPRWYADRGEAYFTNHYFAAFTIQRELFLN